MASQVPNYYHVLGVNPSSTPQEVKNAYRQRALEAHPDKSPDDDATTNFQVIKEAYEVLINPSERIKHDIQLSSIKQSQQETRAAKSSPQWPAESELCHGLIKTLAGIEKGTKSSKVASSKEKQEVWTTKGGVVESRNVKHNREDKQKTKRREDVTRYRGFQMANEAKSAHHEICPVQDRPSKSTAKSKTKSLVKTDAPEDVGQSKPKRKDRKAEKQLERAQSRYKSQEEDREKTEKSKEKRSIEQHGAVRIGRHAERYSQRASQGTAEWQHNQDLAEANQKMYKLQAEATARRLLEQARELEAKKKALRVDEFKKALATPGKTVSREQTTQGQDKECKQRQWQDDEGSSSRLLTTEEQEVYVSRQVAGPVVLRSQEQTLALAAEVDHAKDEVNRLEIQRFVSSGLPNEDVVLAAYQQEQEQREQYKHDCTQAKLHRHQHKLAAVDAEMREIQREIAARETWGQELERMGAGADAASRVRQGRRQLLLRFGGEFNGFASLEDAEGCEDGERTEGGFLTADEVIALFPRDADAGQRSVACKEAQFLKRAMQRRKLYPEYQSDNDSDSQAAEEPADSEGEEN